MKTKVWTVTAMDYYKEPELILSNYEKGYLDAVYELQAQHEAKEYHDQYPEENFWFMQVIGKRTFDLGIWLSNEDDITSEKVCVVYECHPDGTGAYSTDTSIGYYLKGVSNADL